MTTLESKKTAVIVKGSLAVSVGAPVPAIVSLGGFTPVVVPLKTPLRVNSHSPANAPDADAADNPIANAAAATPLDNFLFVIIGNVPPGAARYSNQHAPTGGRSPPGERNLRYGRHALAIGRLAEEPNSLRFVLRGGTPQARRCTSPEPRRAWKGGRARTKNERGAPEAPLFMPFVRRPTGSDRWTHLSARTSCRHAEPGKADEQQRPSRRLRDRRQLR